MSLRKIIENKQGGLFYIQMGIVLLILSALAIPIVGSVMSSVPANTIDAQIQTALGKSATYTPTANATAIVVRTSGTVLGLNPLAALICVAAGMISLLVGAMMYRPGGL